MQVLPTPEHVTIVTQPQAATATCPDCGTISRRIHSHYERLLGDLQIHLGLALGGEAGQRLAERLAMPVSADTLLRMARQAGNDNEPLPTPPVLAVDDWA